MNILVTGGASGLGEAITRKLAADSRNKVYFTWAGSTENADALMKDLPNTQGFHCDFHSESDVQRLLGLIDEFELHGLVNNAMAGIRIEHFHKLPADYFGRSFNENVAPVMCITQEVIRSFRKARFGKIVTILTSYLAGNAPIGLSEYVSIKAYLHSMAKCWATENARYNITSNCVSPSFMLTPLNKETDERVIEQMTAAHPLKKLLTPEESAQVVAFLIEAPQHVNGVNLFINAGERVV